MNKPLKDWTLGEIKRKCETHPSHCAGCPVYRSPGGCRLRISDPNAWDLAEPPCWTENEIKMAKAIKALWPDAEDIRARDGVTGEVEYRVCAGCVVLGVIYAGYFPTMRCGEDYTLDEIIGGAE